ncbi:MAG: membrane lipoprotein lipid attachment site-containing protein [Elusimicrobia bacterium]|nr:membrane lipoprotein lipid attachment site-containing protein [Elusimicrobiota bacterium]
MKKPIFAIAAVLMLAACRHDREPNKIIDPVPVNTSVTVVPGQALQEFVLINRDCVRILVPVLSKLQTTGQQFTELTQTSFGHYTFHTSERRYGQATFIAEFQDSFGVTCDPIAVVASSQTVKQIVITETGGGSVFGHNANLVLSIDTINTIGSPQHLYGSMTLTGSGYTITFAIQGVAGCNAVFDGLTTGAVSATGTGGTPPAPTTINFSFATDRTANGSISWEGEQGQIHVNTDDGSGFVVTSTSRTLLD